MELHHVFVVGECRGGVGSAVVEEFEAEEAIAEGCRVVRDAPSVLHLGPELDGGGEGNEEARGGEFLAEAEHGVDMALAGEADEEDMGETGFGTHFGCTKRQSSNYMYVEMLLNRHHFIYKIQSKIIAKIK